MKKRQRLYTFLLFFILIFPEIVLAQLPSNEDVLRLVIAQKKATDPKDASPFTMAAGRTPKFYPGHYTSPYNDECIVVCPLQQGRDFIQFVLLLYKSKGGFWQNGCWYYPNVYRLKVKDLNKDNLQELILETKINSGNREFGNFKVISLLNLNAQIWYENNTIIGADISDLKQAEKGKEVTKDIKVTFIELSEKESTILKERIIIGAFNNYTDSLGLKLDYKTSYAEFVFREHKYIPKIN